MLVSEWELSNKSLSLSPSLESEARGETTFYQESSIEILRERLTPHLKCYRGWKSFRKQLERESERQRWNSAQNHGHRDSTTKIMEKKALTTFANHRSRIRKTRGMEPVNSPVTRSSVRFLDCCSPATKFVQWQRHSNDPSDYRSFRRWRYLFLSSKLVTFDRIRPKERKCRSFSW